MTTAFADIGLSLITPSLTNPRKKFNAERLQELADSIKASGVHTPVLVRFLPGSRTPDTDREVIYELVAGERRYRASQLAGVNTIPAMIRPLSDDQVLEIQLVENLQRDDLTELEEAEGYESLMQHSGINADQVGSKIGKSRSYVYARLKLLDLSLECKEAMREGKIDASRALLIARIPDARLQAKALEEACRTDHNGDQASVRTLQTWLQRNVMLRLENATFKITDARLVEAAGSCKECPKRTGANPDLFADVTSADICTDPACFHGKEEAHRTALRKMADKKGMRVIEGEEAEEMLAHGAWSNKVEGYTSFGQIRDDITVGGETGKSMRELLGKDAPAPVLFEHPRTKELMELVPTDEAEGVLMAKGLLNAEQQESKQTAKELEQEMVGLQNRFKNEQERATEKASLIACIQAVRDTDNAQMLITSAFLRAWLLYQMDNVDTDDMALALGYTFQDGEDESDGLAMHIRACAHIDLCRAMVVLSLQEEGSYRDENQLLRDCITKQLDVAVKPAIAKAIKEVKALFTPEIKTLQAKIDAKKPVPDTMSVQLGEGAGVKTTKARAGKAKLTVADAKTGIAAAMQELEEQPADPLYIQALELVLKEQKASKRLLKDHLRIGQIKALQLLEQMEQDGKVSACDERGSRKVLVAA
jgi:ParB/RepB/Spo0J family partition protein